VSLWIGEIQWMLNHGFALAKSPIPRNLDNIQLRDAILNPDGTEPEWPEFLRRWRKSGWFCRILMEPLTPKSLSHGEMGWIGHNLNIEWPQMNTDEHRSECPKTLGVLAVQKVRS